MPNYDGIYEVRIIYTTAVSNVDLQHRHTFDVVLASDVGAGVIFSDIIVENWDTTTQPLENMILAYIPLIADAYEDTAVFVRAELWKYQPEPSTDAAFIAQLDLDEPGTAGASPTISAQQSTLTFRTVGAGIMRLQFMETITTLQTKVPLSSIGGVYGFIADFVTSDANAFAARDNSRPFAQLNAAFGQNERLWRKRNRST